MSTFTNPPKSLDANATWDSPMAAWSEEYYAWDGINVLSTQQKNNATYITASKNSVQTFTNQTKN